MNLVSQLHHEDMSGKSRQEVDESGEGVEQNTTTNEAEKGASSNANMRLWRVFSFRK